ncbi:MAG: Rpn family recombination-promoting nuclease/putative transposase [Proteobacteria bacterium]|nr:Rpn family recombination-promoting nuclease/putative transposase [Pseudomonadota bacterium]
MLSKFLDPKNDLAFKRIFGTPRNADILIHFLNDILNLKDHPIQTVKFLKSNQDPKIAAERQSIVDVLCEDEKHDKFIIEMQVARDPGFIKRAQYYASKTYINQRDDGVKYKDLKNVRFLAIYDATLFPQKSNYISHHEMRDIKTQENDLDSFKFVFLELAKFTDQKEDLKTIIQKWAYFFKHASETSEEDLAQIIGSDAILGKAYHELDRFGWSKEELLEYESVDMKIASVKGALEVSYLEGEAKGRAEGEAKGRTEGELLTLKKTVMQMVKAKINKDIISQVTGLTGEKIEEIIKEEENS